MQNLSFYNHIIKYSNGYKNKLQQIPKLEKNVKYELCNFEQSQ